MNINIQTVLASVTASAVTSGVVLAGFVNLQDTTPGTPQTGHINVTGTVRAGAVGVGVAPTSHRVQVTSTGAQGALRGDSTTAAAVLGVSDATGGNFIAKGANGRGLVGDSQASTGNGFGGVFATRTTGGGAGAFARAIGANNTSTGLIAENTAATGKALVARNTANNNTLEAGTSNDSLLASGAVPRYRYTPTTPASMVPIAYGNVFSDASISTGSANFTVTNPAVGSYEINIQGLDDQIFSMIILATPQESDGSEFCSYTLANNGEVKIQVFDAVTNALINSAFSFVIFRTTGFTASPASLTRPDMGSAKDFEQWHRQDPVGFKRFRRAYQDWERQTLSTQQASVPSTP